jgi:hypothetical protein
MIALRRELHQHPELAFEEIWTATTLAERMKVLGLPVQKGIGGTGVLAVLEGWGGGNGRGSSPICILPRQGEGGGRGRPAYRLNPYPGAHALDGGSWGGGVHRVRLRQGSLAQRNVRRMW